jgi:diguanylate cyclase (GGDEF)-like protein
MPLLSNPFAVGTMIAAAMLSALLSMLFAVLWQRFSYFYLVLWAVSFAAGALFLSGTAISFVMALREVPANDPLRLAVVVGGQVFGYLQIALIVLSAFELRARGSARPVILLAVVIGSLVVGCIAGLAYTGDSTQVALRLWFRIGMHYMFAMLAFACAAWLVRRVFRMGRPGHVLALSLVAASILSGLVLAAFVTQALTLAPTFLSQLFGLADLLSTALVGGGMAIWLFEREREHSEQIHQRLTRMELLDPVTGLPNRRHFVAQAALVVESMREVTMLVVALEGFRAISEDLGIEASESLLRNVAERISDATPELSLIGRLRGEEFAVLIGGTQSTEQAELTARTVLSAFEPPFVADGKSVLLSATIGLVQVPVEGHGVDRLLSLADTAIVKAREGNGQPIWHLTAQSSIVSKQLGSSLTDVHQALIRGEFELYYQPIIDHDHQVRRIEALLRWRVAESRVLTPEEFGHALKQGSLAVALDQWVIEHALAQLREWRQSMPIVMAINISSAMLTKSDFADFLGRELIRQGLPSDSIEIELTERAALLALDQASDQLDKLGRLGVKISLDDFGTGYSTLEQLRLLPVNQIKIDRSFVRQLPFNSKDSAIVAALTGLAHGLGVQVIAEGVETHAQREFLSQLKVDAQQGFLYSRPVPSGNVLGTVAGLMSFPVGEAVA